jgi:alkanesulfonate monooxygenase SsuD/methylene tetrahydromethanopterin reductase-like flavin-dependent oxidoreductase (luciferase family)
MFPIQMRFDMRAPAFGAPRGQLYAAALDMAEFADRVGMYGLSISEHHGVDDGYLPSSITLAAAMAARTRQIRLLLSALVVPLHDPLLLAEQVAVLDLISGGRTVLVVVGGYVESEFQMFGQDLKNRAAAVEEAIAALRAAWSGEPFDFRGRRVRVMPRPLQEHLPILMGGSVPVAAKRAGRLADGFITHIPDLYQVYAEAAKAHGKDPLPFRSSGPGCVYIAEDPEAAWKEVAPYYMHEMNAYGKWSAKAGTNSMYVEVKSVEELRASGGYAVVTPEQCVELVREHGNLLLHPLAGGCPPEIGWRSLKLLEEKVLPALRG